MAKFNETYLKKNLSGYLQLRFSVFNRPIYNSVRLTGLELEFLYGLKSIRFGSSNTLILFFM
jgi:hypothetical protein